MNFDRFHENDSRLFQIMQYIKWYFMVSCVIALIIAWITVGSQAIKTADINPGERQKFEQMSGTTIE